MKSLARQRVELVLSLIFTLLVVFAGWKLIRWKPHSGWLAQHNQIDLFLAELQPTQPSSIPGRKWREAVISLREGFWNGCFSPDRVSQKELADLERRIRIITERREIDFETLIDILEAIGDTNAVSQKYVTAYLPCYLENLEVLGWKQVIRP